VYAVNLAGSQSGRALSVRGPHNVPAFSGGTASGVRCNALNTLLASTGDANVVDDILYPGLLQNPIRAGRVLVFGGRMLIDVWGGVQGSRLARWVELRVFSYCTLQLLTRWGAVRPLRRRSLPACQPAFI
jgi:hypothetical protein